MARWSQTTVIVCAAVTMSAAMPSLAAEFEPTSQATPLGARRHQRHEARVHAPLYEPRYYARPYYYRPYPYAVPFPFVLGFGPWRQ